jgi:hypothetical protein
MYMKELKKDFFVYMCTNKIILLIWVMLNSNPKLTFKIYSLLEVEKLNLFLLNDGFTIFLTMTNFVQF